MSSALRTIRLRAVWLLIVPFFYFAQPDPPLLFGGFAVTLLGLVLRGWAAGHIHKNQVLTTGGPYGYTRNPLYLGSLLIGVGVTVAGGRLLFLALFLIFFVGLYGTTIRREARFLRERFGEAYRDYAAAVPLVRPRFRAYRADVVSRFEWRRYAANREWEAALGVAAGFAALLALLLGRS